MSGPTVLVVEDHVDFRQNVVAVLQTEYGPGAVTSAGTMSEAQRLIRATPQLRLALIDLVLPDGDGTALISELAESHPNAQRVVATIYDDDAHLFPALSAGAQGYLLKGAAPEEWLRKLRELEGGAPALSPSIARRILQHFRDAPVAAARPEPSVGLTPRELEVLRMIGRGLTVSEAAGVLGLSEHTVAGYIKEMYRKLNISSRAEAALEAAKRGLT